MLQLLLFGCIVFPLIAAVAVALDKEGTLRRRIVYAGTGITALSALGLALYGSFVLPISPDSSLQPLMTVLDLALLVFILYVAVNIRHRLSMGLALGQLAGMIYLDFFMLEGHQATAFLADPLALVMVLVISLVGGIVCIFGLGYMQEHEDHLRLAKSKQSRFFFFLLLFLGAMNGLVLCDSLTWVFFFWEITTLCSFFLISHDGTREAKRNATRALWMNMVGGIGFLAVHPEARGRGVASALVRMMLDVLPADQDIFVTTYREDDPLGAAPRALYKRLGFEEAELVTRYGYPCQQFVLRRGSGDK